MESKKVSGDFPVVCVGGSAGGLDAYIRLLRNLPADMGVAIVIVNHLRTVATRLHEILPNSTTMPVELITEKLLIEPCLHHSGAARFACDRWRIPADADFEATGMARRHYGFSAVFDGELERQADCGDCFRV